MKEYLAASRYIDCLHPRVRAMAETLAADCSGEEAIARACFEYVRDEIQHSWDYQRNPVTCKASEVLEHGTGYCYAKSHLLAALLRANGIPAGLCYQRLTVTDRPPFCLHGLNAVYLPQQGWYRIDARGNKEGVNAVFSPPLERLAFPIVVEGEADFPEIFAEPIKPVTDVLERCVTFQEVADQLPDIHPSDWANSLGR